MAILIYIHKKNRKIKTDKSLCPCAFNDTWTELQRVRLSEQRFTGCLSDRLCLGIYLYTAPLRKYYKQKQQILSSEVSSETGVNGTFPSPSFMPLNFPMLSLNFYPIQTMFLSSVQFSSVAQSCPTLCNPMNRSTCLFILFMGFSRQEYWSGLPFLSPVDHILSDLSTMTRPSWAAPRAWLSFIELDKAVVLVWLD